MIAFTQIQLRINIYIIEYILQKVTTLSKRESHGGQG